MLQKLEIRADTRDPMRAGDLPDALADLRNLHELVLINCQASQNHLNLHVPLSQWLTRH